MIKQNIQFIILSIPINLFVSFVLGSFVLPLLLYQIKKNLKKIFYKTIQKIIILLIVINCIILLFLFLSPFLIILNNYVFGEYKILFCIIIYLNIHLFIILGCYTITFEIQKILDNITNCIFYFKNISDKKIVLIKCVGIVHFITFVLNFILLIIYQNHLFSPIINNFKFNLFIIAFPIFFIFYLLIYYLIIDSALSSKKNHIIQKNKWLLFVDFVVNGYKFSFIIIIILIIYSKLFS